MRLQLYSRLAIHFNGRACQKRLYASQANASQATSEPLRILFCGSDEFSSTSLRALYKEHERDKALIESINVVCRPAKPVNRGLRDIREGIFFQARFSSVLNQEQYPLPWLQRNWPCPYIRLTRSPSGRSAFHDPSVRITIVETDLATYT